MGLGGLAHDVSEGNKTLSNSARGRSCAILAGIQLQSAHVLRLLVRATVIPLVEEMSRLLNTETEARSLLITLIQIYSEKKQPMRQIEMEKMSSLERKRTLARLRSQ